MKPRHGSASTWIDPATWSISYPSKDIIALRVTKPNTYNRIHIFNVYNQPSTDTLSNLSRKLNAIDPDDGVVVLGDFNIDHPLCR